VVGVSRRERTAEQLHQTPADEHHGAMKVLKGSGRTAERDDPLLHGHCRAESARFVCDCFWFFHNSNGLPCSCKPLLK